MAASADTRTLDVSQFLQGLSFSRYHLQVLLLCSLVTFFDGQDFTALAYALPYIRDEMQISDEMTGYVSSAAFAGQGRVQRQRAVNALLREELAGPVHALSIRALTPDEAAAAG